MRLITGNHISWIKNFLPYLFNFYLSSYGVGLNLVDLSVVSLNGNFLAKLIRSNISIIIVFIISASSLDILLKDYTCGVKLSYPDGGLLKPVFSDPFVVKMQDLVIVKHPGFLPDYGCQDFHYLALTYVLDSVTETLFGSYEEKWAWYEKNHPYWFWFGILTQAIQATVGVSICLALADITITALK